ncbi:PREDICTED: sterol 3-beta-glucosyltransferase UGT80B1-like [Ipomoea nil]|uniref:sterol 3-beta-glucosyltransferase UGT80B1-like n=1 Tax=Ipomoea nil TaxID=35883 RepID=UPI000901254D|nr:PREDICTED: sterol 3-beta-glucosyltransferase UGT80B1-like [Ipomoea nil]XP_019154905.1 PREDICTED: sterol 3-beta-glucosyltransferase UGT80B1-like [Ipomoea nil]
MESNGNCKISRNLEDVVESHPGEKSMFQIHSSHSLIQDGNQSVMSRTNGDHAGSPLEVSGKSDDVIVSDAFENRMRRLSSVVGTSSNVQSDASSPESPYRRATSLPGADLSWSAPPRARRGLGHSITAPASAHRNLVLEGQEGVFSRSMTDKKITPRHELRLDRLSEREKQKLIVELVKIQKDGTVEVDLTKSAPVASELLELHTLESQLPSIDRIVTESNNKLVPKLKIAVLVVGTRGDVQPFLAMAKRLQEFGHSVRLATHANFRDFVKSAGVDFYPLGGDPRVLAGYMARNKGLIPSTPGEITVQRKQLKAIIESLLPACTEADLETGQPFRAQAIIANPPAYGHVHVAEALGVPLHIFFTMPWTPTYEFPHAFARVPKSAGYWLSYIVVDLLIWWGIRSYINDFRKKKLNLPPIAYFSMYYGSISHLPTGYLWSPHVVPKPQDWGPQVDVVGYCFLNLGSNYQPPEAFTQWIQRGSKPIYIGFGSMPLEDSKKTTDIILEALKVTGQRGIIDQGWGGLGTLPEIPETVYTLSDCPHDWLFLQCSAVVHHGGAGTTAAGLRAGCPTTIVPFFGDQFFWGDRLHQKGLGPPPIPISQLTVEGLSEAIRFMLQPEVKSRVMELARLVDSDDGVSGAVDAFHRHLPTELPLPTGPPSVEETESPNPLQWLFIKIGSLCSLACGSKS